MEDAELRGRTVWMRLHDILRGELDGYNGGPQSVDIGGFQLGEMVD